MEQNNNTEKEQFDLKYFCRKNKAKVIALAAALLLIIVLLAVPKGGGRKKTETNTPEAESELLLHVPDDGTPESHPERVDLTPTEKYGATEGRYPSPSFVSANEDTLVYRNGLYVKVEDIFPEESVPDTIEVEGTRYVRMDALPELVSQPDSSQWQR